MAQYSPQVEEDISARSRIFGIVLGILCIPTALLGGCLGTICPIGSFVGIIPVLFWSAFSGTLAAMFLNWGNISHEEALGVGVKVGRKTGMIASIIGAGATLAISVLGGTALGGAAASDPNFHGSGGAASTGGAVFLLNIIPALMGIVMGMLLGILGGVIGAAIKRPAASR